ncbi:MAG: hypothetical protein IJJ14_01140 [Coriobacteriales bacterium]|nr:hypothetical protein [Coriobacteriales bacterium]
MGAQHLNTALLSLTDELMAIPNRYVVQATGEKNFEQMSEQLGPVPQERWQLRPYINEMGDALRACDLVLSRAGATSLAEITALGVPSILVPFPFATDDHQTKNARDLETVGAAVLVPDAQLDEPILREALLGLLQDPDRRASMAAAAKEIGRPNATQLLVDLVLAATGRTQEA